ncbi:MAG: UDP-N-acetylmuramoyl-L-alanyl-D-glutamate--2,6-diaminopimelate ligase, partial [Desulfobacterales bacterium]|nr:UDP-N-acetylmuramoyl-L-alanyl-D-glutamate--2,6-diaminopimelate ligase [Desulfobacterales bacterium]
MRLSDLLQGCALAENKTAATEAAQGIAIKTISCDSRDIGPGSLFLAVDGHAADGHSFIGQAFDSGAAAVIAQHIPDGLGADLRERIILVEDSRKATAQVAANFYGHPSKEMVLIGITGTNGKTTTTWILESIFKACGFSTGVIGTVNIRYGDKTYDNPITTPDAISLQRSMKEMKTAGVTHVLMEVSSHSLDQSRVDGCAFDAAIFTNLTQDHLDYHQTLEDYFLCKQRLFTDYLGSGNKPGAPAIINIDDDYGSRLAEGFDGPQIRVSHAKENKTADIRALDIQDEISGLTGTLDMNGTRKSLASNLTGLFNLENILCAAGGALALGVKPDLIIRGINALGRVPGRLEKLDTPLNRHIFVDYAHTPDALESILQTLSQRAPARVITVFGCGGDRDKTKRAPMGKIACRYSDISIVTSDNPRTESPDAIVADIIRGIEEDGIPELKAEALEPGRKGYIREVDREKALELAVRISAPRDIIVAAGKGHETYQVTNSGTIHFDDMEKLSNACNRLLTPMKWTVADLTRALDTEPKVPVEDSDRAFAAIGTDSRTIEADMVFLALEGESFDGHDFIPGLIEKGISAFVVRTGFLGTLDSLVKDRIIKNRIILFETDDTLAALGQLARHQRMRANVKLVAITGSNGKTTTRKMTREIFATKFDTLATRGNFNNEIGMPLTLLNLAEVHQWAVIEMGMNHPGEISRLSAIARPDIAVITNTSGAHLEGLKTADNVARAKSEIFESIRENGTAVIFGDDPRRTIMEGYARANTNVSEVKFFGNNPDGDYCAEKIKATDTGLSFSVRTPRETRSYTVNSPARFMVNNAMAAIAAARAAGIGPENISTGLGRFSPVKGRMNLGTLSGGVRLIDDTYNANPASMTQALKTLSQMAGKGKGIAALGDMLELGPDSDA